MRHFIIATHGSFSEGIRSSLEIIIGETPNLHCIQAYMDVNSTIEEELTSILEKIPENDDIIIFSDIAGGSVTNQILRYTRGKDVHLVSGINLPLLIDIVLGNEDLSVDELLESSIAKAKDQIVYVNKMISTKGVGEND